ncbi:hypothetical protein ACFL6C_14285 [Myxococcota bacterium]
MTICEQSVVALATTALVSVTFLACTGVIESPSVSLDTDGRAADQGDPLIPPGDLPQPPGCVADEDCDDANPCTDDSCWDGDCANSDNSHPCEDGNACTVGDRCEGGLCVPGANECQCEGDHHCIPFEDGNLCNGTLVCVDHNCRIDPNTVVVCDSTADTPCRRNLCQAATGACSLTDQPNGTGCDDTNGCTAPDSCWDGQCVGPETCCDDLADNDGDTVPDCSDSDCLDDPACPVCVNLPDPEPVDPAPLPGEAPAGRWESTSVNGFQDDYLYDKDEYLKVGIRREWGGSIIYYGLVGNTGPGLNATNTIDANDTGREVQVAFYDPDRIMQNCAWNASCATTPTSCLGSITYLGWNPVQGGNECVRGSGIENVWFSGGVLFATTNPLFWNPDWDSPNCNNDGCGNASLRDRRSDVRVTQSLKFIKRHVLELRYTLVNLASQDHRATNQEMPTVYTANGNGGPDLWRMLNSDGVEIAIDTPGNDGFYYKNFTSPGGWAALQDDNLTYGVGLYSENRNPSMQAWQNRALPFNNFRPLFHFGLPANGTVQARAYLLIGAFSTIAADAGWLDSHLPPFGHLDAPSADAVLSGSVELFGWALDNREVTSVILRVDGTMEVPMTYGTPRSDVCLVWPGYAGCPDVGFSGAFDTSVLTACDHLFEVFARDAHGNEKVIARRRGFVSR